MPTQFADPTPPPSSERMTPLPSEPELEQRRRRFALLRRLTGGGLGLVMGAVFILLKESVNSLILADIPLYSPPPGLPWSAIMGAAVGILIGGAASWSFSSIKGVIWGSLSGALGLSGYALYQAAGPQTSLTGLLGVLLLSLGPIAAMVSAVMIVFRWALDRQQAAVQNHGPLLLRAGIPLALILMVGLLGWTQQYPPPARTVLERMQETLKSGLAAADDAALPAELKDLEVDSFITNAQGRYTLEWQLDPNNRFRIARPADTEGRESLAIARFENGWMVVCLYPRPEWDPRCKSLWQNEAP
jgi:hypothetical protein